MFRPMRRGPQALTDDEIKELLTTATRGVLSVQGDDGYPYGFPINHYYDAEAGRIYFHGANFGHRVDAIKRDPKVSFCVFGEDEPADDGWSYFVKSVIVFGRAELIEDEAETERVSRLLCSKFPCPPEYADGEVAKDLHRTLCFALNIESVTGKRVHES